jgi:hypothetical protein
VLYNDDLPVKGVATGKMASAKTATWRRLSDWHGAAWLEVAHEKRTKTPTTLSRYGDES